MPAPDEWMRRLGTLPLMHQPGEQWMYNTGSDVLGVLIARAAGQPLGDFLRERIFEPLGMKDTGFSVPPSKLGRLAARAIDPIAGDRAARRGTTMPADGRMAQPAGFPVRRRRAGLDGRRLPGLLPDDAGQGPLRRTPHPVAAVGRADDHRSAHGGAEGQAPRCSSATVAAGASAWPWSPGATTVRPAASAGTAAMVRPPTGSGRGYGRRPADPAHDGFAVAARAFTDFWTSAYQAIDD